jgi:hypothetical protein
MLDQMDALRDRYSALSDDELRNLAVTGGLLDHARELLDQELRHRGITDSREYREHLERLIENDWSEASRRSNAKRRLSAVTCVLATRFPCSAY